MSPPRPSDITPCGLCRRPVFWAITANNKRMPLDPVPDDAGNVAAYKTGTGGWACRALKDGDQPIHVELRYMPHFATCPKRQAARQPLPAGVVSLAAARARRAKKKTGRT